MTIRGCTEIETYTIIHNSCNADVNINNLLKYNNNNLHGLMWYELTDR